MNFFINNSRPSNKLCLKSTASTRFYFLIKLSLEVKVPFSPCIFVRKVCE